MAQTITLQGCHVDRGRHIGEQGDGYGFLLPCDSPNTGDISVATRGHYQGYEYAVQATLADGYHVAESEGGAALLYPDGGGSGMDVQEAIYLGLVQIIVAA